MFAASINHISENAARQLAFIHAGIFYVRRHSSITLYRCPSTPVYRLNGHTAFSDECDRQRDRLGHLLFLLWYNSSVIPTQACLSATERRPTKRAHFLFSTPTPCGSTLRRAAVTAARRTQAPCVTPFVTNSSVCTPTSGASACATRAHCSSSPSTCRPASAYAALPTTCATCVPWPSRHWPDTGIAAHRISCHLPRSGKMVAGRRTPLRKHFIYQTNLNYYDYEHNN